MGKPEHTYACDKPRTRRTAGAMILVARRRTSDAKVLIESKGG